MAPNSTTQEASLSWTPIADFLLSSMQPVGIRQLQMGHRPSSMQEVVGGKNNRILKHKLRDVADIVNEPSQADKDRSALVLAGATDDQRDYHGTRSIFPTSRLSYLNPGTVQRPYQITSPAPEATKPGNSINNLLAEYAETIPSDSEVGAVPHQPPHDGVPVVTSDVPVPSTGKKRVCAQANEWSSGDSDDEKDEDYKPSAKDTNVFSSDSSAGKDALNARRREKYWVKKQQDTLRLRREAGNHRSEKHELDRAENTERPSKVVKLTLSPQGKEKALGESASASAKPEFPKGKRVVKKDGYSQTPNAVDYRARIAYQKELEEELRKSLDQDIVRQVEAEGWITPAGRLFKAGIRQMQRITQEREAADAADHRTMELTFESQLRKIQTLEAENEKLRGGVEEMRQVLNKLDLGE